MPELHIEQLTFWTGTYANVVSRIEKKIKTGHGIIVLPCSLNDLAAIDADPSLKDLYSHIDVCTTDGMPLVWFARWKTGAKTERVYGPDLMRTLLQKTQGKKYQHVFFGTTAETLAQLTDNMKLLAPQLNTVATIAPPFRKLTDREIQQHAQVVRNHPQPIIWIGLSSPKQVVAALQWKKQLPNSAIFCVGAAFDFLAGQTPQAPRWLQQLGLEWLFRLCMEPQRLWRRYGVAIPWYLAKVVFKNVFGNEPSDRF